MTNDKETLLFDIDIKDKRFDKILLSASTDPARISLTKYFDSLNSNFDGFILLDNGLRAGDTDKRFLKYKVTNNKVQRKSEIIQLSEDDNIRLKSNKKLSSLKGLLKFSAMS